MKKEMLSNVWGLTKAYWQSSERWWARGILSVVVALNLIQVYLLVLFNKWNNDFYTTLQEYNYEAFGPLIVYFTGIAFLYIIIAVYGIYLRQMLEIRWRTWMTNSYLDRWMGCQTYYRLQLLDNGGVDNPDQRISDDIGSFVNLFLALALGFIRQLTTLGAFVFILWDLSGVLEIPLGDTVLSVPGYMVFVTLTYSVVGTWFAHKVGRKLITLNYDQQRYEADFRFSMVRARENSESIAFYGGERPERVGFQNRFAMVVQNFWGLMKRTKLLNFYVNSYGQLATIVPIFMVAPRYFAGEIQLGGLVQTLTAFGRVQDSLSYFLDAYTSIAQFAAVIRRLGGFTKHMELVEEQESQFKVLDQQEKSLVIKDVQVSLPNGVQLLENLNLTIEPGMSVLVSGASGCGKSTLLRVLAGIWPYGQGSITKGDQVQVMFLPQRPYLPLGSLRQAIYYPQVVPEEDTTDLPALMKRMGIEKLIPQLDVVDDWSRILSLGEQQRLAFIRILLFKPQVVFLDESTSAMDEVRERESYEILKEMLPEMAVVSVGHRSTLLEQHQYKLLLSGQGKWTLQKIEH